jgi:hypothetical protein
MKEKVLVHAYVGRSASRSTRPSNVLPQASPWPESEDRRASCGSRRMSHLSARDAKEISTRMIMVMEALTCPRELLLLMVLGRMGTSGVGICACARETVRGKQDDHQICIHNYNSYRIQPEQARAFMKGLPVGKSMGILMNRETQGKPREGWWSHSSIQTAGSQNH